MTRTRWVVWALGGVGVVWVLSTPMHPLIALTGFLGAGGLMLGTVIRRG